MLGAGEGEKIQSLPLWVRLLISIMICVGWGGRWIHWSLVFFLPKNMLSCGLKDFVVHLLTIRSRR